MPRQNSHKQRIGSRGCFGSAARAREDLVAICADHSPDVAMAVLAVLKAGAAFLPLNPRLPRA